MVGKFAAVSTSLNALRTFRSSNAVPMVDVKTRPEGCHLAPAFMLCSVLAAACGNSIARPEVPFPAAFAGVPAPPRAKPTAPTKGVCLRDGAKLVGAQPVQVGTKLRAPKKTRHVAPEFPELPPGTTVGGLWVGEALIDQRGKIANVWAIRPLLVRPAFPPVNEAIVSALRQWEFEPSMVQKVAVPVCLTVTVNIQLR